MHLSGGIEGRVHLWKDEGKLVLGNGRKEFAQLHTKDAILDAVLFEYVGRNEFEVTFFIENRMEQQSVCGSDYYTPLSSYIPFKSPNAHISLVSIANILSIVSINLV